MTEILTAKLLSIIQNIEELVEDNIDDFPRVEVSYRVSDFDQYDYDKTIRKYLLDESVDGEYVDVSQEKEARTEIPQEIKNEKVTSVIEESEEYEEVIHHLKNELPEDEEPFAIEGFGSSEGGAKSLLDRFIQVTVDEVIDTGPDNFGEQDRASLLSAISREIEQPTFTYQGTIWLYGLGVEFDSTEITDEISISKVTSEELKSEIRMDEPLLMNLQLVPPRPPTLRVDYECKARNKDEVLSEEEAIISLLQLYASNIGEVVGRRISSPSPLRIDGQAWTEPERNEGIVAVLEEDEEIKELKRFFSNVENPFRKRIHQSNEQTYLNIAFDRYQNSLVFSDSMESSIASSIMSLEALYLKENEKAELSERLAQRAGILLGCLDYAPMEVYQRIKSGYDVRSSYVHGTKATDEFSGDLAIRTINFSKESIVLFLQMMSEYDKAEIISKIDNAIMSPNGREKFEEEVNELCGYQPSRAE